MERLKVHLEATIDIINRFFCVDLKQLAKTHLRLTVNSHAVCELTDCILDDSSAIQVFVLADTRLFSGLFPSQMTKKIGRAQFDLRTSWAGVPPAETLDSFD